MTRRARGRGAWRKGAGALCVLACAWSLLAATSCNGRFEFQGNSDGEGGDSSEASGGKVRGFGGGFHGGGGSSGSFGNARGGVMGSTGGGPASNECPNKRCTDHGLTCTKQNPDVCFECLRDSDCTTEPRKVCSFEAATKNRCVECDNQGDCDFGETCADSTHTCVPTCSDDSACTSGIKACNESAGYCVACWDNPDCENQPLGDCPEDYSRCVQCDSRDDCSDEDPDSGEWCDPVLFKCVFCRTSFDCDLEDEVCDPISHTCVK